MHEEFMRRAFELAKKARPSPNPQVGCVLVKDNKIIGQGFHKRSGEAHAEIEALLDAKKKGSHIPCSEMYVTLEPCCHHGKTPPCISAIIKEKIKKVFIAIKDKNPEVNGKGIQKLKNAGIKVELGLMKNYAEDFYKKFFTSITKKRPFITVKVAMSMDGVITSKGRYITCKESLTEVHKLRAEHEAVLIGIGTVLADDPRLNVRLVKGQDPVKVILDRKARTPLNSKVLETGKTIIFTEKENKYLADKCELIKLEKVTLSNVLQILHNKGINSILVEGGQKIFTEFLEKKIVDDLIIFIAPKTLGEGTAWTRAKNDFKIKEIRRKGDDLMVVCGL